MSHVTEIVNWFIGIAYLASLFGMATFLLYNKTPGAFVFLGCITAVTLLTSFRTGDCKHKNTKTTANDQLEEK